MRELFSELKRRNVFRVAIAYFLVAWVLLQVADVLFPALSLPEWTVRFVAALLIIGFPLALFFAWAFELTPEGLKREREVDRSKSITRATGRKLDRFVVVALIAVVAWIVVDRVLWHGDEAPEPEASERSIAVLPFVNMSDDPANEYFSDGVSEELLTLLARIPELRVIGRTSSFQYKDNREDLRSIGETLGVSNILDGSVRKAGNTVRITAQLVSAADGTHIWSSSYDRNLDDVFRVQGEIAAAVVDALRVELLGQNLPVRAAPADSDAYDLYLKGLFHVNRLNEADVKLAVDYFKQAIDLDPGFAPAWEGLGGAYINQTLAATLPLSRGIEMSRGALSRATELDPMRADAYYSSGFREMVFFLDWASAEQLFEKTLAIEANHAGALSALGLLRLAFGDYDEAVALQHKSLRADPLRLASHANLAFVHYMWSRSDLAVEAFRNSLEFSPDYVRGHFRYALALLAAGDAEAALAEAELERGEQWRLAGLTATYHALGRSSESDAALRELIEKYPDDAAAIIGKLHAYRGDADAAFEWLDRACDLNDPLVGWIRKDPLMANVRDDPRFAALLRRMDLPP